MDHIACDAVAASAPTSPFNRAKFAWMTYKGVERGCDVTWQVLTLVLLVPPWAVPVLAL